MSTMERLNDSPNSATEPGVLSSLPNPPTRNKLREKRNAIKNGPWALDEDTFCSIFGEEAYASRSLIEELIKFSKFHPNLDNAIQLLLEAQEAYNASNPRRYNHQNIHWNVQIVSNAVNKASRLRTLTRRSGAGFTEQVQQARVSPSNGQQLLDNTSNNQPVNTESSSGSRSPNLQSPVQPQSPQAPHEDTPLQQRNDGPSSSSNRPLPPLSPEQMTLAVRAHKRLHEEISMGIEDEKNELESSIAEIGPTDDPSSAAKKKKSHSKTPDKMWTWTLEEVKEEKVLGSTRSKTKLLGKPQGEDPSKEQEQNEEDLLEENKTEEAALGDEKAKKSAELKRITFLNSVMERYHHPFPLDTVVKYLDTALLLPADAPIGWPHLIDLTSLPTEDSTGLTIADMVVTVLYNHQPSTLARFMDTSHGFAFHNIAPKPSGRQNFLIVRSKELVSCGCEDEMQWRIKFKFALRATPMAHWTPVSVEKWTGGRTKEWAVSEAGEVDHANVAKIMAGGERFALQVLQEREWEVREGGKIHVRNSPAWRS